MNGIHDMGGMHGFGPVHREKNEPVFHEPWEGRLLALTRIAPVSIPGGFRFALESMDPAEYLASSYYERWLHVFANGQLAAGAISAEELDERTALFRNDPHAAPARREDPELLERSLRRLNTHVSPNLETNIVPAFGVGDAIRTRNLNPAGHTRLPRYVRGKRGVVARIHGVQDFQDHVAPGEDDAPQPVYSVRFDARELWGESAEPNGSVYIDMWESYLDAA